MIKDWRHALWLLVAANVSHNLYGRGVFAVQQLKLAKIGKILLWSDELSFQSHSI